MVDMVCLQHRIFKELHNAVANRNNCVGFSFCFSFSEMIILENIVGIYLWSHYFLSSLAVIVAIESCSHYNRCCAYHIIDCWMKLQKNCKWNMIIDPLHSIKHNKMYLFLEVYRIFTVMTKVIFWKIERQKDLYCWQCNFSF